MLRGGIRGLGGELGFVSEAAVLSDAHALIQIFEHSSINGLHLGLEAKRPVKEYLYLVDEDFRKSEIASLSFSKIIRSKRAFDLLDLMLETCFLSPFIPEFEPVRDRVQLDAFHLYPVGNHLLHTLKYLKEINSEKDVLLFQILSELQNPESLFVAALFHDIGKIGRDHSQKGARIAGGILSRFGYQDKERSDVLFLIKEHLLLMDTATRRDLNDEKVVVQCARAIDTVERIKMLYLLTWGSTSG